MVLVVIYCLSILSVLSVRSQGPFNKNDNVEGRGSYSAGSVLCVVLVGVPVFVPV